MNLDAVITWLYYLISRSQSKKDPYYCDCCTTECERTDFAVIDIRNTDQTNPALHKKKYYRITIEEINDPNEITH